MAEDAWPKNPVEVVIDAMHVSRYGGP